MVHPITTEVEQRRDNTTDPDAANATSVDLQRITQHFNLGVDVSDVSTVTVEVSHDGTFDGEEKELDSVSYGSATQEVRQYNTTYQHTRAYADGNVTELELVARGF